MNITGKLAFAARLLSFALFVSNATAAEPDKKLLPHKYTKPPNQALSPTEALARMTVPAGFTVELVASEPDIVNPVAMTFDERGRVWITESLEYPRKSAGPGRDRIKVLEDTDGDGRADKFTVFAEGLNIPSGIAVGAGGVWVANSPDILFMQDTDGDGRADKQEVVVTGFGRADTHELPNSLTWGPDGYLYGLNGVFNPSKIVQGDQTFEFTCAMFRIHPYTRKFEIFCEGTSNPWGIAFNDDGEAFVSACVIDHLWHLTETGYYHRQGGPYPPFTWKIESIVQHKHQKAAYCGIAWFDSDAYPQQYREKLYMGNIHGNCINVDRLERNGSTYKGHAEPDFLQANDDWFMPIVQKTGPDGCLYILDWYDQYHCYQDANRDPAGIDRLKGRLYRVRYKDTPRAPKFDLTKETDDQLIERLKSPNIYFRDIAQRLLWERKNAETIEKLRAIVLDKTAAKATRMHALWAVIGSGPLDLSFHFQLYLRREPMLQAWCIRAVGNDRCITPHMLQHVCSFAINESGPTPPEVMLQVAIATAKLEVGSMEVLLQVAENCGDDQLIAHIVWNNLQPFIESKPHEFIIYLANIGPAKSLALAAITPRALARLLSMKNLPVDDLEELLDVVWEVDGASPEMASECARIMCESIQNGVVSKQRLDELSHSFRPLLADVLRRENAGPLRHEAALLATTMRLPAGTEATRQMLASAKQPDAIRLRALDALVAADSPGIIDDARQILNDAKTSPEFRRGAISALGKLDDPRIGPFLVEAYPNLAPGVKPQVIELLTQRSAWTRDLLAAVAAKRIHPDAVNVTQLLRLQASKDPEIAKQVTAIWGAVRTERNPQREQVITAMRDMLNKTKGDAHKGQQLYQKLCGQCHKLHGQGQEVGPDITVNGRASYDQLLSNVFDPSLVIGNAYQGRIVVTDDGRTLTGLLVEDSPQRVVLKVQGGKLETIARTNIEQMEVSKLSLMPEGVEKQYTPQEIADLIAFLTLDKPPDDPQSRPIPGTPKR